MTGVGGVGASFGVGAAGSASGMSGANAAAQIPQLPDGTVSLSDGVILPNATPGGVAALAELMEGFSTSELILALLFLAASQDKDDDSSGTGGLLAGLAMASGLGGGIGGALTLNIEVQSVSPVTDATQLGTQLDLSS